MKEKLFYITRNTLIIILLVFKSLIANGDMHGTGYQYKQYSENGNYYFKSIPFSNSDWTTLGKTTVYDSKTKRQLYNVDNYLSYGSFLSNSGDALIATNNWLWQFSSLDEQKMIEIFFREKKSVKYYIKDLIINREKLQRTSSHYIWYEDAFVKNDTLNILTLENILIRIELIEGKIVARIKKENCNQCLNSVTRPKKKYYRNIKYPKTDGFPKLTTRKSFRETLILYLNKIEAKSDSSAKYYIVIYGLIDKFGNCEVQTIQASKDTKEDSDLKKRISDWVANQRYKTNLIPKNCDKWLFQDYFYLN
jgi:hypothetical protein